MRSCATGRAPTPRTPTGSPPSWPSGARPTSSAASPRTGRTATSSSCCSAASALRAYGSQGQQRAALLALLFAERALLAERRARPPLMLLDDVMSELDAERRELLADLLRSGGQAVITTTEPEHVPGTAWPAAA